MKCLLCSAETTDQTVLIRHYEKVHSVNTENYFFKGLFKKKDKKKFFFVRKCYRCEQILSSRNEEKIHNFLKHFHEGGKFPIEDKPITMSFLSEKRKLFRIEYKKHKNSYDFGDDFALPNEFFNVVDIKFNTDGKNEFIFNSTFGMMNY